MRGEADKLNRILVNLLQNAVEHASEGTSILLSGKSQDEEAVVSIYHKGQILNELQIATLFKSSSSGLSANHNNSYSLSLALSKAFIELQGGQINVSSQDNDGTTITFTLPAGSSLRASFSADLA